MMVIIASSVAMTAWNVTGVLRITGIVTVRFHSHHVQFRSIASFSIRCSQANKCASSLVVLCWLGETASLQKCSREARTHR